MPAKAYAEEQGVAYGYEVAHSVAYAGMQLADACESVCGSARGSVWV